MNDDRRWKLEADLASRAHYTLSDRPWPVTVDGEKYDLVDDELYVKLAGDEDFNRILIRRESDGALFEVEADVSVWSVKVEDGKD